MLESLTDLYPNNYFPYVGDVYGATPENITPGKGFKEYVIQSCLQVKHIPQMLIFQLIKYTSERLFNFFCHTVNWLLTLACLLFFPVYPNIFSLFFLLIHYCDTIILYISITKTSFSFLVPSDFISNVLEKE